MVFAKLKLSVKKRIIWFKILSDLFKRTVSNILDMEDNKDIGR